MDDKYSFENFIIQCCKSTEGDLRKFLKRVLKKAGFSITEDDYSSYRKHNNYNNVHNLLAIRGNPRTCLVAHTDVCRDHGSEPVRSDPVLKLLEKGDDAIIIIQDRNCEVQVGGDDRLGVAINTWIALNSGYDMALLFTTDEEVGLTSAQAVDFKELLNYEILVQVDRGNHSDQLVTEISGTQLCSNQVADRLINISRDINLPRYKVSGFLTDVLAIKRNGICKNAVNMTCGYHNSIGDDSDEYIDIEEARNTMKYVASIVQYHYLEEDKNESNNDCNEIIYDDDSEENSDVESYDLYKDKRRGRSQHRSARFSKENDDLFSESEYNRDKGYSDDWEVEGRANFLG